MGVRASRHANTGQAGAVTAWLVRLWLRRTGYYFFAGIGFLLSQESLSKFEYDQANSSVTGPLQKPGRRDLVGGVVERKKKKLARSEGEQVLGANRASKIIV